MTTKGLPLISVVIPTYNHAKFLRRALESIVSQEFKDWEIIIIDNHSDDNTDEVVDSFKGSTIKFLKIHNGGVIGASRNYGVDEAKGEWIAFMDSDDLWYPSRLSSCVQYCESSNSEFDVISTDEIMVFSDIDKKKTLKHGPSSENMYRDMLLYGNRLSPSATIVRKSFLDQHNLRFSESQEFVTAEDYDFWMRLARNKAKFIFLRNVEGEYSIHGNNASSQLDKQASANKCVLMEHVFELQEFETDKSKLWRKVRSRIYFSDALKRLKVLNISKAITLLLMSFFSSPFGLIDVIWTKMNVKK